MASMIEELEEGHIMCANLVQKNLITIWYFNLISQTNACIYVNS